MFIVQCSSSNSTECITHSPILPLSRYTVVPLYRCTVTPLLRYTSSHMVTYIETANWKSLINSELFIFTVHRVKIMLREDRTFSLRPLSLFILHFFVLINWTWRNKKHAIPIKVWHDTIIFKKFLWFNLTFFIKRWKFQVGPVCKNSFLNMFSGNICSSVWEFSGLFWRLHHRIIFSRR